MTDYIWEYRVVPATSEMVAGDGEALEQQLDELGSECWELVAVDPSGERALYVFKRPVPVVPEEGDGEEGDEAYDDADDDDEDDDLYDADGTIRINPSGRR